MTEGIRSTSKSNQVEFGQLEWRLQPERPPKGSTPSSKLHLSCVLATETMHEGTTRLEFDSSTIALTHLRHVDFAWLWATLPAG